MGGPTVWKLGAGGLVCFEVLKMVPDLSLDLLDIQFHSLCFLTLLLGAMAIDTVESF